MLDVRDSLVIAVVFLMSHNNNKVDLFSSISSQINLRNGGLSPLFLRDPFLGLRQFKCPILTDNLFSCLHHLFLHAFGISELVVANLSIANKQMEHQVRATKRPLRQDSFAVVRNKILDLCDSVVDVRTESGVLLR